MVIIHHQVINFQVVLASGNIVDANESENADLWRALRGGGYNFGIVTRLDMRSFKQDNVFGGTASYSLSEFPYQIEALVRELKTPSPESLDFHFMMSVYYTLGMGDMNYCKNQVYYNRPTTVHMAALNEFVPNTNPDGSHQAMQQRSIPQAARRFHQVDAFMDFVPNVKLRRLRRYVQYYCLILLLCSPIMLPLAAPISANKLNKIYANQG